MDEDDSFLYGEVKSEPTENISATVPPSVPQPVAVEKTPASLNGLASHLEGTVQDHDPEDEVLLNDEESEEAPGEEEDEADESDDDVEFIMEPPTRSLDFRSSASRQPARPPSTTQTPNRGAAQPSLTTEYTPRDRSGLTGTPAKPSTPQALGPVAMSSSAPRQASLSSQNTTQDRAKEEEGPDTSTLPPVTAPPSHPSIDPSVIGMLDGRSILEVDLNNLAEKPWRRPGSDISDWFNYGFDEISWEAYCYRRRDLGELAHVLKTNVVNFAGMPEDQLLALPPEVRTMVMTGANALMNVGAANPAMMGAGVAMNPMVDMSGMGSMNMGPLGMGMNGDMSMQMQGSGPMLQEVPMSGPMPSTAVPEQSVQMAMGDGFGPGGTPAGMVGMGMGGDFVMQDGNAMAQQMYPGMDGAGTPIQAPTPTPPARGGPPAPYRGRGGPPSGLRGRGGGYSGRGRGRGYGPSDSGPSIPVRPASPLPPGVPTGPRNQNKYKDRDGNAPAVDGLDYGGIAKDSGRTPSAELEERNRKRRSSPPDDIRGLKRR